MPEIPEGSHKASLDVSLVDVHVQFDLSRGHEVRALRGIDLDLQGATRAAVVGASGCGKTTLLRVLAGLQAPTRGSVAFGGHNASPPRGAVSMLFQGACHLPWLTVSENLAFRAAPARRMLEEEAARLDSYLLAVGLEPDEYGDRYVNQLSGGQARRVELAMALSSEPQLLLLDEPTTGLDYMAKRTVESLIETQTTRPGLSTVLVTHDLEEAVRIADVVHVLKAGEMVGSVRVDAPRPRCGGEGSWPVPAEIDDLLVLMGLQ